MAPEVIKSKSYGTGIDIWSIGVITYLLISGKTPFNGNTRMIIANNIKNLKPDFDSYEWNYVSKEAKHFITQCL